jgi:hypothetical protein
MTGKLELARFKMCLLPFNASRKKLLNIFKNQRTLMTKLFKDTIIPWLFKWEGTKLCLHKDDRGNYRDGRMVGTKYGIDAKSHPNVDIPLLTADEATEIYWNEYWVKYACDEMAWPLNFIFFNCCVNCGLSRASKILKISGNNPSKFIDEQEGFYKRLVIHRPASKVFLKGWLNRTKDLRKVCNLS